MTDERARLVELFGSMQRDVLPSLIRMEEQDDLRLLHLVMLQALERTGEPTVKELAALIGRSESRTSRVVEQMVRRGLVGRREDEADRRARRLRIGEEGTAVLRRLRETRIEAQVQLMRYMTASQRRTVLRALEHYAEAARRLRDERGRSG